ncbi:MAG TPA: ABC transporter permease, partial [Longimicrobiales bacterium]|nr:ABC transporter permease [Longimicrobiales bacterium]
MSQAPGPRPPRILRRLLAWLLPPGAVRDGLLGDLDALYAERARSGRASAGGWYAHQLLSAAVHSPVRRVWKWGGSGMMDRIARDLGYACRTLRRRPGFASLIVLTLALGIGANTAVFSVVRSVLLRPLPFPEDERLAVLLIRAPMFQVEEAPSSPPEYVAYRDHARSWVELAAFRTPSATVSGDVGDAERVIVARATPNLFTVLRIEPALGRVFSDDEDREAGGRVAVLSHALWMSRYGGDPEVIGRTVLLDGAPRSIVGVMPPEFRFPTPEVRVWLPIRFTQEDLQNRGNHSFSIVGRLRPGVALASAEREVNALIERFVADPSFDFHQWHPAFLRPLRGEIVGDVGRTLWV